MIEDIIQTKWCLKVEYWAKTFNNISYNPENYIKEISVKIKNILV